MRQLLMCSQLWRHVPYAGRNVMTPLVVLVVLTVLVTVGGQGYSLDYDYLPHFDNHTTEWTNISQGTLPPQNRFDAKLRKCRCKGNQAWNSSGCVERETHVTVMNLDTHRVGKFLDDAFREVEVQEVQCPPNYLKVVLDPRHSITKQFSLLPNGALYWQWHQYEHHCIDHTLDSEEKANNWVANVCLPPPKVPLCCPMGFALSSDDFCSNNSIQRFSPPVMIDEELLQWPEVPGDVKNVTCKEYDERMIIPLNNDNAHILYMSGNVSLVWPTNDSPQSDQIDRYCLGVEEGKEGYSYKVIVCYEDQMATHQRLCEKATCVRKCCPEGYIHYNQKCIPADSKSVLWAPLFIDADDPDSNVPPPEDLTVVYGFPQCAKFVLQPDVVEDDEFYLLRNGFLFNPTLAEAEPPTRYCIDNFLREDNQIYIQALLCFPDEHAEPMCARVKTDVYPALQLVSCVFLGATLGIYISVPDLRDKLHGRCLMSLVSAFFVAYVLMAISNFASGTLPPSPCRGIAYITYLSLLAAFFWLNVMCFDIWRTLRKTRTVVDGGRAGRRRFLYYSLYSWGCALFLAIVAVIMDNLPPSYDILRPDFSSTFCWFGNLKSLWVYFYAWVSILILANVIFFGLVLVILIMGQNNSMLRRSRQQNRERMWLYVKLFLVMGVTWVAEVVSSQAGYCHGWILTDVINALQGFTIFLVFALSRNTIRKVRARCCKTNTRTLLSPQTTITSSSYVSSVRRQDVALASVINFKDSSASRSDVNNAESSPLQTVKEHPNEHLELSHDEFHESEADPPGGKGQETCGVCDGGEETTAMMPCEGASGDP